MSKITETKKGKFAILLLVIIIIIIQYYNY